MKKVISLMIVAMFCLTLIAAQSELIIEEDSTPNFFKTLAYDLKKNTDIFTAAGTARGCGNNGMENLDINAVHNTLYYVDDLLEQAGCSGEGLINTFADSSYSFLSEYRTEDFGILHWTRPSGGRIQVYCCPYPACNSDSDCSSSQDCNENYGSCYTPEQVTSTTNVYQCREGSWSFLKNVEFGEENYCLNVEHRNYIDQSGSEHCATSPNSVWCTPVVTPPVTPPVTPDPGCGDGTCNSDEYCYTCPEDCGLCTPPPCDDCESLCLPGKEYLNTAADTDCNNIVSSIERIQFQGKWVRGEITRNQLGIVLEEWVAQNE